MNGSTGRLRLYLGTSSAELTKAFTFSESGDFINGNDISLNGVFAQLCNINIYVGEDGKLHFVNSTGADTVIPFNRGASENLLLNSNTSTGSATIQVTVGHLYLIIAQTNPSAGTYVKVSSGGEQIWGARNPSFSPYVGILFAKATSEKLVVTSNYSVGGWYFIDLSA